jgi:hypothetical protein
MKHFNNLIIILGLIFIYAQCPLAAPPYPQSDFIKSVSFNWATHARQASGSDNWPMTWAEDDHQYTSWGDGGGFGGSRVSLGIARISGAADNYTAKNLWTGDGKTYGIICVNGMLYFGAGPGSGSSSRTVWTLYKSTDHGSNFTKAGWTHKYDFAGIRGSFINHGKNNGDARDDYIYCPMLIWESRIVGVMKPGHIYLARVHKDDIFKGTSYYKWYKGISGGSPLWGSVGERKPIYTDNNGIGWSCNIVYNPGLKRYILTVEYADDIASNLGMFESTNPWGPWKTVFYGKFGSGKVAATCFFWCFAPKWFRNGGKDFTIVFTGTGENDSWNTIDGSFDLAATKVISNHFNPPSVKCLTIRQVSPWAVLIQVLQGKGLVAPAAQSEIQHLHVFNVKGRLIETLLPVSISQEKGLSFYQWNTQNVSTGLYIVGVGDQAIAEKVVLVR